MCNRARNSYEPETLRTHFGTAFGVDRPMDNRFNPAERMTVRGPVFPTRREEK